MSPSTDDWQKCHLRADCLIFCTSSLSVADLQFSGLCQLNECARLVQAVAETSSRQVQIRI